MYVQQFFVQGLAHLSYIVGGNKSCAVIDPKRDVDDYIEAAKKMGLKITHILETHLHADFISGHMELAERTGATICAPKDGNCKFDHLPVTEGDSIEIEDMEIRVLGTGGHTPEHVSYVVIDHSRGKEPVAVFTGDTLFVGDVGRPDLFPGRGEELASLLYDNIHNKILKLPDFCEVYPAHGAGSLCGRAMGAKRSSTVGYEQRFNTALQYSTKDEFMKALLTGMPETPDHFMRCSEINREGPTLISSLPVVEWLDAIEFNRLREEGHLIIDIRDYTAFGGAHIPGSYHLDLAGNFSTFAGWIIPPEKPLLLVWTCKEDMDRAIVQLQRVGLDQVVGYLGDGIHDWAVSALHLDHICHITPRELDSTIKEGKPITILDVRAQSEWDKSHLEGAIHIVAPDVRDRYNELDKDKPIAVLCNTTHRSSMAASILKQKGFNNLNVLTGGMTAWQAAGFSDFCPACELPHGPRL